MAQRPSNKYYLITPDFSGSLDQYLRNIQNAIIKGVGIIQLRSKHLSDLDYKQIAQEVISTAHKYGAKVLLNNSPALCTELGADGVHFSVDAYALYAARPSGIACLSLSCHNIEEAVNAQIMQPDVVLISAIFNTPSSPYALSIGWEGFYSIAKMFDTASTYTYALGGVEPRDLHKAEQCGGYGIAAKRAFWSDC